MHIVHAHAIVSFHCHRLFIYSQYCPTPLRHGTINGSKYYNVHIYNQLIIVCIVWCYRPFPKEVHHEYYQDLDQLLRDAEEEPQSNEESIYANLNELAM